MAEDAVRCEPLSAGNSLVTGKNTGYLGSIRSGLPSPGEGYSPSPEEVTIRRSSKSTRENRDFLWPYQGTLFPDKTFFLAVRHQTGGINELKSYQRLSSCIRCNTDAAVLQRGPGGPILPSASPIKRQSNAYPVSYVFPSLPG